MTRAEACELYAQVLKDKDTQTMRWLCLNDLFFLVSVVCRRFDMNRDWVYARCREVAKEPDGYLDLWSREHWKSSIITFGLTIQDILKNPDITVGIFSHTRPIAKAFLAVIKRELEANTMLQDLFPDVLYLQPWKESPRWSLDEGIIVKRKSNPKESTVEAWGLVDGQPTSKHYALVVYDDTVVRESVTTPEMIAKTTQAWELSLNLGSEDGVVRTIGTRYHQNDTYSTMIERGSVRVRIYPATDDGTLGGNPVVWDREYFDKKVRDMGSYTAACQLLQNPLADKASGFSNDWLEYYDVLREGKGGKWNYYLICDPATEKKKESDYTVQLVVGCAPDGNYYLVDGVRDRMNLTERTASLFRFHRKWKPVAVGYEKYGMQSDIEHIKYVQALEGYRFRVVELGGAMPKNDRIRRLVPLFENHRVWFPRSLNFRAADGRVVDLIRSVIDDEYMTFPVGRHDDFLDCLSRICDADLGCRFPTVGEKVGLGMPVEGVAEKYDPLVINKGAQKMRTRPVNRITTWQEIMRVN